jgi:aminoglycoside/choline kinase family phosphotransferase
MFVKTLLLEEPPLSAPRASLTMYRTELDFYRQIRPRLEVEAPQMYGGDLEESTGRFIVLIEDLGLRGARFPNATGSLSADEVAGLLATLARVHARYWASPALERDFPWLERPLAGEMVEWFRDLGPRIMRKQLRLDWKAALVEPLHRSEEQLWDALWKLQAILDEQPLALIHGDAHVGNTYLLPDGGGGLLDWQLTKAGSWAHDLTYLIVTALDPELRRIHERELIAGYLSALAKLGVTPPSEADAWLLYRQNVVWGLVIGWVLTPPTHHGQAIISASLSRCVTAAMDLESFAALD